MIRIVILGSGNVAYSLARAIAKTDLNLVQIYSRNQEKGSALAQAVNCDYTNDTEALAPADLYIISVTDRAIDSLVKKIKIKDSVIAHTAGSVPIEALAPSSENHGVIYPLQTFSYGSEVDFTNLPILIEGSNQRALACIRKVSEKLSSSVTEASSKSRKMVHLAAVFSCNFVNHMYVVGERILQNEKLPFDLIKPLIIETTRKALEASSPTLTQTGPAVRNDYQTKAVHCEMLAQQAELKTIYINLSNCIWETSKKI